MNDIAVIRLSGKREGLIVLDAEDAPWLRGTNWYLDSGGYPICNTWNKETKKARSVRMHSIIHKVPKGSQVDHINGFRFDNRKLNLRTANQCQSSQNTGVQLRQKLSKFKGVSWRKDTQKWAAYIGEDGKKHNLGSFPTELEAAQAYNHAATERFGEFARLNDLTNLGRRERYSMRGALSTLP